VNQQDHSEYFTPRKQNKSSAVNIFLNISLTLLSVIIIYLLLNLILNIKTIAEQNAEEEGKLKPAKVIQLEVLNGCGTEGAADRITGHLRENKFDVVRTGNYRSFNLDYTLVIDRTGNIANAGKVAEVLGINHDQILQQTNKEYFLDVTLIIGKDFNSLKQKQE
jgi:hypothetical protein